MIKNFVPREHVYEDIYELRFFVDEYGGCAFPCDKDGNVLQPMNPYAEANLKDCLAHPERYETYNKVVKYEHHYVEPAHGTCRCGQEVYLTDEYYGACECPKCGQWYNLFGQELNAPEYWNEYNEWED